VKFSMRVFSKMVRMQWTAYEKYHYTRYFLLKCSHRWAGILNIVLHDKRLLTFVDYNQSFYSNERFNSTTSADLHDHVIAVIVSIFVSDKLLSTVVRLRYVGNSNTRKVETIGLTHNDG
jgi:hypothetical protein